MTQAAALSTHGTGSLWKTLVAVAFPLGAVIATVFATWISSVQAEVQAAEASLEERTTAERTWNETAHFQQELRFNAQFVEVRSEMGELRRDLSEAVTLLKVLEERSRP